MISILTRLCYLTVDSRNYDSAAGIRKTYQYIHTIDITSLNFYFGVKVGIQIWYRSKQHFAITDIVITRKHCILIFFSWTIRIKLMFFYCSLVETDSKQQVYYIDTKEKVSEMVQREYSRIQTI
jgi:hypothetical protein